MAILSDELYSLIIPLRDERLVVPRACVAEVIRYTALRSGAEDSAWLRGNVRWRDREIPVIALECLLGSTPPPPGGRTRIVIFSPLSSAAQASPYGILSQGFPQMVRLNAEVIRLDESYRPAPDAPVICKVAMLSESALVPDLEAIEQRINEPGVAINPDHQRAAE